MTVVRFDGITKAHEPSEELLEKAKTWESEDVLVLGCDENGALSVGGNTSDVERVVWMLNAALHFFMKDFWEEP